MSWNYRVVKIDSPLGTWYEIREAYYNSKGEIWALSQEAENLVCEDIEGLHWTLETMLKDLDRNPVIDLATFEYAKFDDEEGSNH